MLSLPKFEKGVRSAAGAVKRVRKVVTGVLLGAVLASSSLHPSPARAVQETNISSREVGGAGPRTELGALLLRQGSTSTLLAGHRSHSSHRSHASHYSSRTGSSDYSPPSPAPAPKTTPPPAPAKQEKSEPTPAPETPNKKPSKPVADEIKKLAQLRDQGIITKEEFEARKRKLLEGD